MPRLPPPEQASGQYANNVPGTYSPLSGDRADKQVPDSRKNKAVTPTVQEAVQEVERIESKYWHNRLIAFCKKKITPIIYPPPTVTVSELVDDLTQRNSTNPQKVLAALKLHTGRAIKLQQSEDGKLGFVDGKVAISTKTMEAVVKSIKQGGVEIAYDYLRKGEKLPAGYLQQIILPHIHHTITQAFEYEKKSGLTLTPAQIQGRQQYRENHEQYVATLLKQACIENEQSFTFERMLEFKKQLRNSVVLSVEEQKLITRSKARASNHLTSTHQQAGATQLHEPRKTDHFIEQEDSNHIQKLVSGEHFFSKIHLNDMGNRLKRGFLRNKRRHLFFIGGFIASLIISVIFPPAGMPISIALAISAGMKITYEYFYLSVSHLWRRIRLIRGLREIKKYADFDHTDFGPKSDKKRKQLIQRLLYRCHHKTFSQIYNAYADLEKQAIKLRDMAEKEQKTLSDSIMMEKEKALYRDRRKKLKSNLYFFDKLIEQVTISRLIIECRNQKDLELLWDEKFKDCNPIERNKIFRKASENLVIQGHQVVTEDPNWLRNLVKFPTEEPKNRNRRVDQSVLKNAEQSKVFRAAGTFKKLTQATVFRTIKKTIFMNMINLGKLLRRRATITVYDPFTIKPHLAGTFVFFGFFFLEMATSQINTKHNQTRLDKIKNKRKGYTRQLFGKRLRTGREEVGTLRSMAKAQVEPMVNHLLESVKSMEKTGDILEDTRKRSKMLGKGPFGAMSDEEAARLILKHAAWQQLLDQEINNAFGTFHSIVQEKAASWNSKIARALIANSKKVVSAVSNNKTRRHLSDQVRKAAGQQQHLSSALQQLPSETFLRNIRNRVSGKLIHRFRKGKISEGLALRQIAALNNLDELLALQFWIDTALKEGSYHHHQDTLNTLKKFYGLVTYIINNKFDSSRGPQHPVSNQRPTDP